MKEKDISQDRRKYLRKQLQNRVLVISVQILLVLGLIILWEVLADAKIIDSFIMSQPSRIWNTLVNLSSNGLLEHIGITCFETIVGFLAGAIIGSVISIILWWSKFLSKVFDPFLVVLNSLPKTALGPVIIVWVGAGMPAIIVMGLAISLIVTIMEISNGFKNTDKEKIKMAESFKASKWQVLTKIVIPSNIATFINSLKINIGLSLVGVITGEFLVSKGGLGYLIVYGGQVFKLDLVMASVFILAVLATLLYYSVTLLDRIFIQTRK
ncbi:MAG: ABC transporter permease [Clostridia bacterium]|nr:ABC transporter permease [Clostridia bacterium]